MDDSGRTLLSDKEVVEFQAGMSNCLLTRISAKQKTFRSIDFRYTIFDMCYFHGCVFIECNFTGCRFIRSNFNSAKFYGCTFDYALFEHTLIDKSILDNCCPSFENLKMKFARTLRMNFQQLGDASAVNKAISVELEAEEISLLKSWKSNESYYRNHYRGLGRLQRFAQYAKFKVLDFVWGNGESLYKLIRSTAILLAAIAINDVFIRHDPAVVFSYLSAAITAPQILLGTLCPEMYSTGFLTTIHALRLIIVGFFMAIIIKRLNRR